MLHWIGLSICVFTTIREERVPSSFSELVLGVLFLLIKEKILSSPALLCGIVITTSAASRKQGHLCLDLSFPWVGPVGAEWYLRAIPESGNILLSVVDRRSWKAMGVLELAVRTAILSSASILFSVSFDSGISKRILVCDSSDCALSWWPYVWQCLTTSYGHTWSACYRSYNETYITGIIIIS